MYFALYHAAKGRTQENVHTVPFHVSVRSRTGAAY